MKYRFLLVTLIALFSSCLSFAAAPAPLLKCTVTKRVLFFVPAAFSIRVYDDHRAGALLPSTPFTISRAVLNPDRTSCDIQLEYDENYVTLSIPMNFDSRRISGTHNGDPIEVTCINASNGKHLLTHFMQNYQADLTYCLMK